MELETKQSQASRRDRGHTAIFTYADAEDSYTSQLNTGIGLASNEETAASYAKWFDAGAIEGIVSRVLYRQDGDDALSVKHVYLKPHRAVPRHKHNTDCLYVVTYGSLLMGNRELKPADGYYAPKDHPYTFTAGPIGAEFLEFRDSRFSNHEVCDADPAKWETLTAAVVENRDIWRQIPPVPPSRIHTDEALAEAQAKR